MGKKGAGEEDGEKRLYSDTHYPHSEGVEEQEDCVIELSRMIPTIDTASERRYQVYSTVDGSAEIGIYCIVE